MTLSDLNAILDAGHRVAIHGYSEHRPGSALLVLRRLRQERIREPVWLYECRQTAPYGAHMPLATAGKVEQWLERGEARSCMPSTLWSNLQGEA